MKRTSRAKGTASTLLRPLLIGVGAALLGIFASFSGVLSSWSNRAADRLFLDSQPDPSILIVAIDDDSITRTGRWPWDRSVHADLIRMLAAGGARVIGYDVNFPEPQDAANDNDLASAIISAGNVVLPAELELIRSPFELTFDPERTLVSIPTIASAAKRTGHSNAPPDPDGVVRRIPVRVEGRDGSIIQAFGYEIAKLANPKTDISEAPRDGLGQVTIHYPGPPFFTYETVPAADFLEGNVDPALVEGRTVIVGSTAQDLHDEYLAPTSMGTPMPGVEMHAGLVNTFLTHSWLQTAPAWLRILILLLIGLFIGLLTPLVRARWSAFAVLFLWVLVIASAFVAFDRGMILDIVWPTMVLLFAYAGVTLERRISAEVERRKLKSLFSRYVSPAIVETILDDPSKLNLGGERKRMTVFFSDIRGFTTMSESLEPEALVTYLNAYLDRMTDIVFKHEGVLDKYIGDAVMAFWNAPFDQNDHALRAVMTALDMRDSLREMNAQKAFGDQVFKIGMGVNTGDMIVGNTGGKVHTDYTVLGDSVNLASRLEGLTKEYGADILVSEFTADELGGKVLVRKLDKVAVKGKKETVTIYEVVDLMDKATMEQKEAARAYEDALDDYFARRFRQAAEKCQVMLDARPDDKSVQVLCERAHAFMKQPPTEDWDGRWVFTKK